MIVIKGIAASPGIAIGKAYVVEDDDIVVERIEIPRDKIKEEVRRFKVAQKATHRDLDAAEAKVLKVLGKHHAKLIDAHRLILKDSLITHDVPKRIQAEGVNAEFALSEALEQVNRQFERMEDEFFRERRHDLFDVGKRLLLHLMKRQKRSLTDIDEECILISRNLLPSDTMGLKETKIIGFATDLGGKTSHTAILAQSQRRAPRIRRSATRKAIWAASHHGWASMSAPACTRAIAAESAKRLKRPGRIARTTLRTRVSPRSPANAEATP